MTPRLQDDLPPTTLFLAFTLSCRRTVSGERFGKRSRGDLRRNEGRGGNFL